MTPLPKSPPPAAPSRSGMALVVTLVLVVLITATILAFFSHVTANRRAESSRTHRVQADLLAHSGARYVVGHLLKETGELLPTRALGDGVDAEDEAFANLLRQSRPTADPRASEHSTAAPDKSGRQVSAATWNAPRLLGGDGLASSDPDADLLPHWIYIGRTAPLTGATPAATPGDDTIGRFAYNVYDIGGLADANAFGHLSTFSPAAIKGDAAGGDLAFLSGDSTAGDALITFRDPAGTDIAARVRAFAAEGYLEGKAANPGNASLPFLNRGLTSRKDLIRYVEARNPDLLPALPYLTHFSRALNAPSWGPMADSPEIAYADEADLPAAFNRFVPGIHAAADTTLTHYRDDGTTVPEPVRAGNPIFERRFSLARLAWLGPAGIRSEAFAPDLGTEERAEAVRAVFGLEWDAARKCWTYTGSDTPGLKNRFATLAEVAAAGRAPNFFEWLQAGILTGSLGKAASAIGNTNAGISAGQMPGIALHRPYQIVRIAANLIDQYDADSYPTRIAFGDPTSTTESPSSFLFAGIEDLPYINKFFPYAYWPGRPTGSTPLRDAANQPLTDPDQTNAHEDAANIPPGPLHHGIFFELWNPHRPAASAQRPTVFRLRPNEDGEYRVSYYVGPAGAGYPSIYPPAFPSGQWRPLSEAGNITFSVDAESGDPAQSYREPNLIHTGSGAKSPMPDLSGADVLELAGSPTTVPLTTVYQNDQWLWRVDNNFNFAARYAVFVLEYQDAEGDFIPYTSFLGLEEAGGVTGVGGTGNASLGANSTAVVRGNLAAYGKTDPRTDRFDVHHSFGRMQGSTYPDPQNGAVGRSLRPDAATYHGYQNQLPTFISGTWGSPAPLARLASNDPSIPNGSYADPDGVTRPGDAIHGALNPFASGSAERPVILNRPFRSVAEMGYAYRDLPFKTLDFFTPESGDAGLLDLFCVSEEPPMGAGKVSLYTVHPKILESLLRGTEGVSDADAATLATLYTGAAMDATRRPTAAAPRNVAGLVALMGSFDTLGNRKSQREAALTGLIGPVQTRTWNLLIDVVAQSGTFPGTGREAGDFVPTAQRHYWLSVAIDRFAGKLVDQQWEVVDE